MSRIWCSFVLEDDDAKVAPLPLGGAYLELGKADYVEQIDVEAHTVKVWANSYPMPSRRQVSVNLRNHERTA